MKKPRSRALGNPLKEKMIDQGSRTILTVGESIIEKKRGKKGKNDDSAGYVLLPSVLRHSGTT